MMRQVKQQSNGRWHGLCASATNLLRYMADVSLQSTSNYVLSLSPFCFNVYVLYNYTCF